MAWPTSASFAGSKSITCRSTELRSLIAAIDWDTMFGSTSFPFKNVRRKEDARSYPSRLEFGLKNGLAPPAALNDGQQVDLLLARIAAPYYGLARFDDLPTPFRAVAVDLRTASTVVLDRGSLATALRATMSLPGVFPPVRRDGAVLVDGGALDNIPADVVRASGAGFVIAVDVGAPQDDEIDESMFGLLGRTIDVTMRSAARAALAHADLTIAVDVAGFGSLDWRRADELIERGYAAAQAHRAGTPAAPARRCGLAAVDGRACGAAAHGAAARVVRCHLRRRARRYGAGRALARSRRG